MAVKNLMQIADMCEVVREEITAQTSMECDQVDENYDENCAQDELPLRPSSPSRGLVRGRILRGAVVLSVLKVFYHRLIMTGMRSECLS